MEFPAKTEPPTFFEHGKKKLPGVSEYPMNMSPAQSRLVTQEKHAGTTFKGAYEFWNKSVLIYSAKVAEFMFSLGTKNLRF
jgi:hypothetical protein